MYLSIYASKVDIYAQLANLYSTKKRVLQGK